MADNGNDDLRRRLEAQEQTSKAQQEALDNIQQMLAQLLINRSNNDNESNHNEEEHHSNEQSKTEKSKEGSSVDAEVLKSIQAQIAFLAQRDELKKVGAVRPYPLNGIQYRTRQNSSHQCYMRMMVKAHQTSTSTTSGLRPAML